MSGTVAARAHAKLNLGLRILGKRADGFHDLESVFVPLELHDLLSLRVAGYDSFRCSDPDLPTDGSNLVQRAIDLWREAATKAGLHAAAEQPLAVDLDKRIPAGAGLGGGSSDAASCLLLLNELFAPGLESSELYRMALTLGSDLPFFLLGSWAHVTGRGEVLNPIPPFFDDDIVLVWPALHVATGPAFAQLSRFLTQTDSYAKFQGFRSFAGNHLSAAEWPGNDFERVIFANHPELACVKQKLLEHGARYAAMSGSGSTIFGLFDSVQSASRCTQQIRDGRGMVMQTRALTQPGPGPGRGSHEYHRGQRQSPR